MNKKIILLTAMLIVCTVFSAFAFEFDWQNYGSVVEQGDIIVNAGVGFGSAYSGYKTKIPPISASVEYLMPVGGFPLGFGGIFGYASSGTDSTIGGYKIEYSATYLMFAGLANWHFNFGIDKMDFYSGILLGYNAITLETKDSDPVYNISGKTSAGGFLWGGQIGARYFFTDKIGAMVEAGYGIAYITAGLTVKF